MKVRIKGNFVRYRLSKTEVQRIAERGSIVEQTFISPKHIFSYALIAKDGISSLEAEYIDNKLTLFIPKQDAKEWYSNTKVGYRATVKVDAENILVLLIEKDFQCLDETEEDQSDNFANPLRK
jgi:hypothetical protein